MTTMMKRMMIYGMLMTINNGGVMLEENRQYINDTILVRTPIGAITVVVVEDNGKPVHLFIYGGKNGTELSAYCDSIARLGSELLQYKNGLDKIMEHLSSISTGMTTKDYATGVECRSGAEGIYIALMKYKQHKYQDLMQVFGDYRPARIDRLR